MSYTITTRLFQANTNAFFDIVEQTVWNFVNGGTWTKANGAHTLTMSASGTSGTMRLQNVDTGEFFLVALGVHNFVRWCDIVPDLASTDTGTVIQPQYYNESSPRAAQREKTMSVYSVESSSGFNYKVNYTVPTGNQLEANIIIF